MKTATHNFSHNGRSLSYTLSGSGSFRLLFIHGLGGDSSLWAHQLDQFSNFECIAIDAFNHGDSSKDVRAEDVVTQSAEAIRALAKSELAAKPTVIIAHSWGGRIVAEVLAEDPNWVAFVAVDALCIRDEETVKVYQDFSNQLRSAPDRSIAIKEWFEQMLGTLGDKKDRDNAMQALYRCPGDLLIEMTGAITKQPEIANAPPLYVFECDQYFADGPAYSWKVHFKPKFSHLEKNGNHFFFLTKAPVFNAFLKKILEEAFS